MITAPYFKELPYDLVLKSTICNIKKTIEEKEDDYLLVCVGSTGTGKSMLMLHAMELYLNNEASVDYVGLNKASFAKALHSATHKPKPRFSANDEANISKREAITKYNRDVLDLYYSVRGLEIFHWWNNPSLEMLDRPFIKERIKGIIFISTKDKHKPRLYYFFTKKRILELFDKFKNLDLKILKKNAKKYAYYRGWFRDYKGKLRTPYLKKKESRMIEKIDKFNSDYGDADDYIKQVAVIRQLGIVKKTFEKYEKELLDSKALIQNTHYKITPIGKKMYSKDGIQIIVEYYNKYRDGLKNMTKNLNQKKK